MYRLNTKYVVIPKCQLKDSFISPFTVVCLVAKPLDRSEAKGDLVMIQTSHYKCKLLRDTGLYPNKITFSLTLNQRLGN